MRRQGALFGLLAITLCGAVVTSARAEGAIPRYDHVFVIVEENHTANQILGSGRAPAFDRLAQTYGSATQFFAETHPSEPNYIAMLGGDTLGVTDDDAYYCKPKMDADGCESSESDDYVDHTTAKPGLMDQIAASGLTWKGYFEDIPAPGSPAYRSAETDEPGPEKPEGLYASKHNGFMNFKSVQDDPRRAEKIVGFDALTADIAKGALPNFAVIVPNQCNDMHGMIGRHVPWDCFFLNHSGLVARADRQVADLVARIIASPQWQARGNAAIVITFDENDTGRSGGRPRGCCGSNPDDPANPGGGWIATIVITNHGPRGLKDPTPYNHYSLLRTMEQAFGIKTYLGHAADTNKGVTVMAPLFELRGR